MAGGRACRETQVHLRGNAPLFFYSTSFCSWRAHEPTLLLPCLFACPALCLLSTPSPPDPDPNPMSLQLFENQSVVEYWESFASHAFENTTKAVYSHCVLLKPSGAPLPATFCFSIRRDIFDLPSIVIGESSVLFLFLFDLPYVTCGADEFFFFACLLRHKGQWLPLL